MITVLQLSGDILCECEPEVVEFIVVGCWIGRKKQLESPAGSAAVSELRPSACAG